MTYPVKIEFKDYPSGGWVDWSQYLVEAPTIDRKVESENEGEAGVIVFDNASVSFRYQSGNPVYSAFSIDLSSKQRYLFRISAPKSDKSYVQLFEGMADFSTITWLEDQEVISFEIVDKLSALALLLATPLRGSQYNILYDKNTDTAVDTIRVGTEAATSESHHKWMFMQYMDATLLKPTIDSNTPALGEVIQSPFDLESLAIVIYKGKKPGDTSTDNMYLDLINFDVTYPKTSDNSKDISNFFYYLNSIYGEDLTIKEYRSSYDLPYQDAGNDLTITLEGGYEVVAYEGLALIEALVKSQWPEITIVNRTGLTSFPIPLEYYIRLIDENPFGDDPLGALKTLADTMKCYIFIDRSGNLVIEAKDQISTYGTTRTLGNTRIISKEKKYFWDKIVDGATVTVKSWIQDQYGDYIEGQSTQTKQIPGSTAFIKPKNDITKDLLTSDSSDNTVELLNAKAASEASDILDFYGKRHGSYDLVLHMDDNVLEWDILDKLSLSSVLHFFVALSLDLAEKTARLTPVEIQGHDYDVRQVVVTYSEDNYNSPSGSSSGSGSTIIIGGEYGPIITALDGLDTTTGLLVQTGDSTFAKRKITALDAGNPDHLVITNPEGILGDINLKINTLAELQVAKVGIGGAVDAVFPFKVYGDSKFTGNITVDGNIYVAGNVNQVDVTEMHVADKVVRVNVDGDNTTAIGSGIIVEGTAASDLASILYDGNWTHNKSVNVASGLTYKINNVDRLSETVVNLATGGAFKINSTDRLTADMVNLATGGAFKINSVDVLNATTLGSSIVNSSLTKVATLTQGIWNATAINAPYINFETHNLKNDSNKLNTIQNIATTDSPQFVNETLTGVIDVQGTGLSKFASHVQHPDYVSQLSKWRISNTGEADFRYLFADELHVKAFIADLEQALAGGQIISKSVAVIAQDFTVPAAGNSANLVVESFAGFENAQVFQNGDIIRLRQFDRTDGSLTVADAWGSVTFVSLDTVNKTQTWSFARSTAPNSGTAAGTINKGTLALDYGVSGNGFIESSAVDGLWGLNSPYTQIVSWTGHPATGQSIKTRTGNLRGITGVTNEYGIILGDGVAATDKYLRASNQGFELHNIPLNIYYGSANRVSIESTGDVRFGTNTSSFATTSFYFQNSTGYVRVGNYTPGENNINFTGSKIELRQYDTVLSKWEGTTITLGEVASGKNNIILDASSISLRNYLTDKIKLNGDGSGFLASNVVNWDASGIFNIGNFTVDSNKFYNGGIRLEASTALKGLAVNDGVSDVVTVGDFTNATESYITTTMPNAPIPSNAWTIETNVNNRLIWNSYGANYGMSSSSTDFALYQWRTYMTLPINDVKGKTIKISFGIAEQESAYSGSKSLNIWGYIKTDIGTFALQNITPVNNVYLLGTTPTYETRSITASIPSNATWARFYIAWYKNGAFDPADVLFNNWSFSVYSKTIVELNSAGFKLFNSPISRINLTNSAADFDVPFVKASTAIQIGNNWILAIEPYLEGDGITLNEKLTLKYKGIAKGFFSQIDGTYSHI